MRRVVGPLLVVAVMLALDASPVHAQTASVVFGGVSFASITGAEDFGLASHPQPGLVLGVGAVYPVNQTAAVQFDASYVQKYAEQRASGLGGTAAIEERFDYIETILAARLGPRLGTRGTSGYVLLGGGFSTLLRAKAIATVGSGGSSSSAEQDIKPNTKSGDVNVVVGGGVVVGRLGVEARYDLGLFNLDKDAGPNDPSLKTRAFSVVGTIYWW